MPWTTKDDFTLRDAPDLTLRCDYTCLTPVVVSKVSLRGYADGEYKISLDTHTEEAFNNLLRQIVGAGFPVKTLEKHLYYITKDPGLIAVILSVVKKVDPQIEEIEMDIFRRLQIDLSAELPAVPTWHQLGDFSRVTRLEGAPLIRHVTYRTCAENAIVGQFVLCGYINGSFVFDFNLAPETSSTLSEALAASGLPLESTEFTEFVQLRFEFRPQQLESFCTLLSVIRQNDAHFNQICDAFQEYVQPIITATPELSSSTTVPDASTRGSGYWGGSGFWEGPKLHINESGFLQLEPSCRIS